MQDVNDDNLGHIAVKGGLENVTIFFSQDKDASLQQNVMGYNVGNLCAKKVIKKQH